MDNPLIRVIVPVYKVEKYLDRCVESIVNQTYKNLEIILVDDGSLDNCPAICDSWAEKDSRIKVIHKENGGAASARNTGLDVATGDYIGFVDSDDYIESEMYEHLLYSIIENNSDISICGHRNVSINGELLEECGLNEEKEIVDFEYCFNKTEIQTVHTVLWNKLYKSELWREIRFPNYRIHEDEATLPYVYAMAEKISIIKNEILYNYRFVIGGAMHGVVTNDNLVLFEIFEKRLRFIKNNFSEEFYITSCGYCLNMLRFRSIQAYAQKDSEGLKTEYKKRFLEFYRKFKNGANLSIIKKFSYKAFALFPNIFCELLRLRR